MSYSIKAILHSRVDKLGLQKIQVRVIYKKQKSYAPTDFKCRADQFLNGQLVDHPHKVKINASLRNLMAEIETRLLDHLRLKNNSDDDLKKLVSGKKVDRIKLPDFMDDYANEVEGKRSKSTTQVYRSLATDLRNYDSNLYLDKIDIRWLHLFEQDQRNKWEINTINKKMKHIKAFLKRAEERGLIDIKKYSSYKVPTYEQKIPEYISEKEMAELQEIIDVVKLPMMKLSGYYFLLSCYAGYRLSDLKRFNKDFIKDDKIILKTKKNKSVVSIPLHSRLKKVVDFCLNNPMTLSEQHMRDYVHELVKMAGIQRRITIHTARHSFAMMLMDNGFDIEDAAELLGNTIKSAQIYARISNSRLEEKVRSRLG